MTSRSPKSAASSPEHGDGHTGTAGRAGALTERVPWRSVGTSMTALGTPVGTALFHPLLGEIVAIVEVLIALAIVGTALFGSTTLSDRAFRLLRWIGNRPEPPAPEAASASKGG